MDCFLGLSIGRVWGMALWQPGPNQKLIPVPDSQIVLRRHRSAVPRNDTPAGIKRVRGPLWGQEPQDSGHAPADLFVPSGLRTIEPSTGLLSGSCHWITAVPEIGNGSNRRSPINDRSRRHLSDLAIDPDVANLCRTATFQFIAELLSRLQPRMMGRVVRTRGAVVAFCSQCPPHLLEATSEALAGLVDGQVHVIGAPGAIATLCVGAPDKPREVAVFGFPRAVQVRLDSDRATWRFEVEPQSGAPAYDAAWVPEHNVEVWSAIAAAELAAHAGAARAAILDYSVPTASIHSGSSASPWHTLSPTANSTRTSDVLGAAAFKCSTTQEPASLPIALRWPWMRQPEASHTFLFAQFDVPTAVAVTVRERRRPRSLWIELRTPRKTLSAIFPLPTAMRRSWADRPQSQIPLDEAAMIRLLISRPEPRKLITKRGANFNAVVLVGPSSCGFMHGETNSLDIDLLQFGAKAVPIQTQVKRGYCVQSELAPKDVAPGVRLLRFTYSISSPSGGEIDTPEYLDIEFRIGATLGRGKGSRSIDNNASFRVHMAPRHHGLNAELEWHARPTDMFYATFPSLAQEPGPSATRFPPIWGICKVRNQGPRDLIVMPVASDGARPMHVRAFELLRGATAEIAAQIVPRSISDTTLGSFPPTLCLHVRPKSTPTEQWPWHRTEIAASLPGSDAQVTAIPDLHDVPLAIHDHNACWHLPVVRRNRGELICRITPDRFGHKGSAVEASVLAVDPATDTDQNASPTLCVAGPPARLLDWFPSPINSVRGAIELTYLLPELSAGSRREAPIRFDVDTSLHSPILAERLIRVSTMSNDRSHVTLRILAVSHPVRYEVELIGPEPRPIRVYVNPENESDTRILRPSEYEHRESKSASLASNQRFTRLVTLCIEPIRDDPLRVPPPWRGQLRLLGPGKHSRVLDEVPFFWRERSNDIPLIVSRPPKTGFPTSVPVGFMLRNPHRDRPLSITGLHVTASRRAMGREHRIAGVRLLEVTPGQPFRLAPEEARGFDQEFSESFFSAIQSLTTDLITIHADITGRWAGARSSATRWRGRAGVSPGSDATITCIPFAVKAVGRGRTRLDGSVKQPPLTMNY